ncbi:MAG: flagellar motor protein MotA [Geminicoccaceae bacterium]
MVPQRFIYRPLVFLVFVVVVVGALHQVIWTAFQHNPWLNGVILAILLFGIFFNIRRVLRLKPEARWIDAFRTNAPGFSLQDAPRLLAPIAAVLGERQRRSRTALSTLSLRHLLDSISSRLDENRDISGYLRNLLIFLGLLGTFWGLIQAIGAIGGVISGLTIGSGDFTAVFNEFKAGLLQPLTGMGTAFSASLFGLAGSLVLGFLDLQASQAEQNFYNELEEWLSGITRLAVPDTGLPDLSGGPALPAYLSALLQQTADNIDRLQQVVGRGEQERGALQVTINQLNQNLAALADRLGRDRDLVDRVVGSQQALVQHLTQRADAGGLDQTTRDHIRNTDLQLGRLLDELARGRVELSRELRNEIKLVARTIAIVAGEPQVVGD